MVPTPAHRSRSVARWVLKLPWLPIVLLAPLFIFGIFGPWMYPHDPQLIDLNRALQPPGFVPGGEWSYFLGTDQMGRDLLSVIIQGARASLLVAVFGVIISGIVGVLIGSLSGYFGGKVDAIIMRVVDAQLAIPNLFMVLMLVAVMRQLQMTGLIPIIVAIAVTMWVPYAAVARGEILSVKETDYVRLAKVTGCSNRRILFKHIWPNITNSLIVVTTAQLGTAVMAESGMSFLGIGVQPPNTAWGLLITQSVPYMSSAWWVPTFAGIAITITVLGANLLGDWLRDTLDPTLRRSAKPRKRPGEPVCDE